MGFEYFVLVATFIFGTIIGSFLNVVIYRFNTGKGLMGRSSCFSCGKVLAWFELVPIVSFLFQQGRCLKCKCKISWQYPLVELITGVVFTLIAWKLFVVEGLPFLTSSFLLFALYLVIFSILIVIAVYDLKHTIIPNFFVYLFILLSSGIFFMQILGIFKGGIFTFYLQDLLAPLILFLFFGGLWLFSGGRWMGFGDAKLSVGIGLLLGWKASIVAFLLSFWVGAIVGILLLSLKQYSFTMKSEIPFGPFLAFGTFLTFIFYPVLNSLFYYLMNILSL